MIHNTIKIRKRMEVSGTLAIPLCREIILLRIVIFTASEKIFSVE